MKLKTLLVTVIATAALSSLAFAQTAGGRQGRGGFRNNPTISNLVYRPDVQADLSVTDEEKAKLEAMRDSLRPARTPGAPRPTPEEMQQMEEASAQKVESVLTADQVKRLHEIQIQLLGPLALERKNVQEELGLSADQNSKLKTIFDSYRAANASVRQKQRSNEIDSATAAADRAKNLAELKTEAEKVMTPEQMTKLEAMGGKHFTPALPANG